ncbi:MAG: hypothetical protein AAB448_01295, partial [Patescibacteria group bacterium]
MDAQSFFDFRIKRAKEFGFPDPIFINAEKLSQRTRVIYLVEIQATFISDKIQNKTHHYALKFSKFKKIKEENNEQSWTEEDIVTNSGFTISDKESLEKLAAYIKANEELLGADVLSQDYVSVILSNDEMKIDLLKRILESSKDKEMVFSLFKDQYPDLDKKILTFKLVQSRKKALEEFQEALSDVEKKERNYWQPFLEENRWMFGLSYFILLDESRVDLENTTDY